MDDDTKTTKNDDKKPDLHVVPKNEGTTKTHKKSLAKKGFETPALLEAFQYYVQLGIDASYQKVGMKFGVSLTTVANWAKRYRWQDRIKGTNDEAAAAISRQIFADNLKDKQYTQKHLNEEFVRTIRWIEFKEREYAREVAEWRVSPQGRKEPAPPCICKTMGDIERLVKLKLLLMGEKTELQQKDILAITAEEKEKGKIIDGLTDIPEVRRLLEDFYRDQRERGNIPQHGK